MKKVIPFITNLKVYEVVVLYAGLVVVYVVLPEDMTQPRRFLSDIMLAVIALYFVALISKLRRDIRG